MKPTLIAGLFFFASFFAIWAWAITGPKAILIFIPMLGICVCGFIAGTIGIKNA